MRVIECPQGSPEWHQARAGIITASNFKVARSRVGGLTAQQKVYVDHILAGNPEPEARELAGYKQAPKSETIRRALAGEVVGEPSESAKNYAFRVAVERISGEPLDEGFETWAMRRGHELEPVARMEHELQSGLMVERAGFVVTDDGLFGASADGLIEPDGGSEYKCFIAPDKLRAFHIDGDVSEVIDQVQGCMWITGRRWWHIGLYCEALEPVGKQLWWREFARDDTYIEALASDLREFSSLVDTYETELRKNAA
ncbi:lambda exonuclease family protein [Halomonas sp. NO4]|uniref:lambda exonuclease family protein n=1 Tax=Halomonas sp. NO4 TaxID=2484813 RepID=UPI0013D31C13|nr:lambda exonuclease family protein [Halomonas sp. NO4]